MMIMSKTGDIKIMKELKKIKRDLKYIKEHMVDVDTILTADEEALLSMAKKEYDEGKPYI
ncbi:MAG: hypothetical protein AB7U40_03660 [Methanobacteriales archaeon]